MKINDVEKLTKMSKKTIRFYEEQDLIHPSRLENGYREYTNQDVDNLLKIKFLRNLSVPIDSIRKMQSGDLSLAECMEQNNRKVKEEQQTLDIILGIGEELSSSNTSLEDIDLDVFDSRIKQVNKGGRILSGMEEFNRKKMRGAFVGASIFAIMMLLIWVVILVANRYDPMPTGIFIIVSILFLAPVVGAIWAIIERAKELKRGEEYEAIKY